MVTYRDTDLVINSVFARLGMRVVYKVIVGPRSTVEAGTIGGVLVGLAIMSKQALKRYVPIRTLSFLF